MPEPETIVTHAGAQISVTTFGKPDAQPVLFLHGGLGSHQDFAPIIDEFDHLFCVMIDSRGHGGSTLGADRLTYSQLAGDVEAVIHALGLDRPVIVGHSDGGIAGIHVAARKNCPLAGLVTIGANMNPPRSDSLAVFYDRITARSWRERFPMGVKHYEMINPSPDFDLLFSLTHDMWRDTSDQNYPGDLAARIDVPTLVLGGDADHLVSRSETIELAETIRGAALGLFPNGSHIVHLDQPELVVPWILAFIHRVGKTNPGA